LRVERFLSERAVAAIENHHGRALAGSFGGGPGFL
jgi:hypothetical protein